MQRAITAWDALQAAFTDPRTGLLRETAPPTGNPYAYHWPFSQALAAALDIAESETARDRVRFTIVAQGLRHAAERYWTGQAFASYVQPPFGTGGDVFYDDNAWTGQELLRFHRLSGEQAALDRARAVFAFIVGGWDTDASHPAPGGVFWKAGSSNHDRNTVSNAPSAVLGLELYALTGDTGCLHWATRMYDWVHATLHADNDLYWDHIDLAGEIERTQWSYNQGPMIDAGIRLHQATGDERYLTQAEATANAARAFYTVDRLLQQDIAFNALYAYHLARLDTGVPDALRDYTNRLWERRDPDSNLLTTSQPLKLLDQAGFVRLLAITA